MGKWTWVFLAIAACGGSAPDDIPWCTVQTCHDGCCNAEGKCAVCPDGPKQCRQTCDGACGTVDDLCGATLDCGACAPGVDGGVTQTPDGGTCARTTCAALGRSCGAAADGCGGTLSCGACTGTQTCGGAGTPGVCGAVCTPGCPAGFTCDAMGVCQGGNLAQLVFDEPAFAVTGRVTVNGAVPVKSGSCSAPQAELASVEFLDGATRYRARVSIPCNTTDFSFSTRLPRGTFEVRVSPGAYSDGATARLVPGPHLVRSALSVTGAVANLVLDEAAVPVAGKVTVNGALPARNAWCQTRPAAVVAQVSFREAAGAYGSVDILCSTTDFGFSTLLPAGTWDVRVEPRADVGLAGLNLTPLAYLARAKLAVTAAVSSLVLDEAVVPVSGKLTVAGAPPTGTRSCTSPNAELVRLRFTDAQGNAGTQSIFCSTTDFAFSTFLPRGTHRVQARGSYDARLLNVLPGEVAVAPALVVTGAMSNVVLDETAVAVAGKVTFNGATPARNTWCAGHPADELMRVTFHDTAKGYFDSVMVPCSAPELTFALRLPVGTYEVQLARASAAVKAGLAVVPVSHRVAAALVIGAATPGLAFDVKAHGVGGKVTVNGSVPAHSAACATAATETAATVELADATTGTQVAIAIPCGAADFAFSGLAPPGTYAVRVSTDTSSPYASPGLLPLAALVQPSLAVAGAVAGLALNEVARPVAGRVTVNGATPMRGSACPSASVEVAAVGFTNLATFAYASVPVPCGTTDHAISTRLPPGLYSVDVRPGSAAAGVGLNLLPAAYRAIGRLAVP